MKFLMREWERGIFPDLIMFYRRRTYWFCDMSLQSDPPVFYSQELIAAKQWDMLTNEA